MASTLARWRRAVGAAIQWGKSTGQRASIYGVRRSFSKTTNVGDVLPIKFLKDQEDIKIMEDKEYPEWLWELPQPGAKALTRKIKENFDEVHIDDVQRLAKLRRRAKIREHNDENRKN